MTECGGTITGYDIKRIYSDSKEDGNAVFTPIREDLLDIIVKDISGYEFERIVNMLFDHGKVDITSFKNKTFYEDLDDYKNNGGSPNGE